MTHSIKGRVSKKTKKHCCIGCWHLISIIGIGVVQSLILILSFWLITPIRRQQKTMRRHIIILPYVVHSMICQSASRISRFLNRCYLHSFWDMNSVFLLYLLCQLQLYRIQTGQTIVTCNSKNVSTTSVNITNIFSTYKHREEHTWNLDSRHFSLVLMSILWRLWAVLLSQAGDGLRQVVNGLYLPLLQGFLLGPHVHLPLLQLHVQL